MVRLQVSAGSVDIVRGIFSKTYWETGDLIEK